MQFPASDAGFRIGLALHVISLLDYAYVECAVLGKGGLEARVGFGRDAQWEVD